MKPDGLAPALVLACLAAAPPAPAQAAAGREIALQICSACHVVAPDQMFPPMLNRLTPSFAEIANRPGASAQSLRALIARTHWDPGKIPMTMPDTMLTSEQRDQVVGYILSLRTRSPG